MTTTCVVSTMNEPHASKSVNNQRANQQATSFSLPTSTGHQHRPACKRTNEQCVQTVQAVCGVVSCYTHTPTTVTGRRGVFGKQVHVVNFELYVFGHERANKQPQHADSRQIWSTSTFVHKIQVFTYYHVTKFPMHLCFVVGDVKPISTDLPALRCENFSSQIVNTFSFSCWLVYNDGGRCNHARL